MTQSDRWKKRPAVVRYHEFKDELRCLVTGELEPKFRVIFNVKMPKSWSERKKDEFEGKPHQQRPDIDNYLKALMDALSTEDSYIYDVHAIKRWAREGSIELYESERRVAKN